MIDEAEIEGYVYFSEWLAQHGILAILSSNLGQEQIHLPLEHVRLVTLQGLDHREGDISKVCLPDMPHELFDRFMDRQFETNLPAGTTFSQAEIDGTRLLYFNWYELEDQPLLKDDFAQRFRDSEADAVMLDAVPFFAEISLESIGLTFLGRLARFVNFVDAIHDCRLPLLLRGTQPNVLDAQTAGYHLRPILLAYDQRTGSHYGQAAWVEWTRCLSRLRSREAMNAQIWRLQ